MDTEITYRGYKVPKMSDIDLRTATTYFSLGMDHWCTIGIAHENHCRPRASLRGCIGCIMCVLDSGLREGSKVDAFARYAAQKGLLATRSDCKRYSPFGESDNFKTKTKMMET